MNDDQIIALAAHGIDATPPAPTAGNEPAALAALRELVEIQGIRERAAAMALSGKARASDLQRMYDQCQQREPIAWEAARAAISGAAQPGDHK